MQIPGLIDGFSRLDRNERIRLVSALISESEGVENTLNAHLMADAAVQQMYNKISENQLSNFVLPFSIAPNFLINGRYYLVPMVTEESSVVAASAAAAKFRAIHGGFSVHVQSRIKPDH